MLAGMFAGRLIRGRGYGPVGDVLLGLTGGIVGSLVLGLIGLGGIGHIPLIGGILVGVIGAVILVWLLRLLGNRDFAA
ncbi:MAG: GlsB/YeaQ/YmgE family stress response membrane protein [Anaerolineae bacterium]|nr:GlsB/YeaQ/YmgE family stress response membrane protein [Anaerolineae bacterium]